MPTNSPFRAHNATMTAATGFAGSKVVLFDPGAYPAFSNYLNGTFTWNGTDWTNIAGANSQINLAGPLPTRADMAMSYDGYNVMLFGGKGSSEVAGVLGDCWTYNGTAWTKESTPPTALFGRYKAKAALITSTLTTVMFGGMNALNQLQQSWLWNGNLKTWTLATPTTSPSVRVDFAFSGGPNNCVLFGGSNSNSILGDLWSFNGTNWTLQAPTGPAPTWRTGASMAYDTANSQWVLFGGKNGTELCAPETYVLNAGMTAWTKVTPAVTPSSRTGAAMCYDPQSAKILMVGGRGNSASLNDSWSYSAGVWTRL